MINYCLGFAFSQNGEDILLIGKNRPNYLAGRWNGLGGKVESNETAIEAMVREMQEEAGILIPCWYWHKFAELNTEEYKIDIFFTLHNIIYEARSMTDEKICIFNKDYLPVNVKHNVKWLVPMALTMYKDSTDHFQIQEINI